MVKDGRIGVALIGAGLQGSRYAAALKSVPGTGIAAVADSDLRRAETLAVETGARPLSDWAKVLEIPGVDAVLITTPPHLHAPMAVAALKAGKHVLCEKPLALSLEEAAAMLRAAQENHLVLGCGFNYRHHPGIRQAKTWYDQGGIGELIFMRCRHGIIGRPGYEQEWRCKPGLCGGGHLMEQGIHVLDLFRWFAGDFHRATAFTATGFWEMAPLEDNAFCLLETAKGQVASLHSSLTQWRNLFSFEAYGRDGYVQVEGLGGSYGTEQAILGRRDFNRPFTEKIVDYRGQDRSFAETWREFLAAVRGESSESLNSARDGYEALKLVLTLYRSAREGVVVKL